VHALPSLQPDPFGALVGVGHCPVAESQVPATLHVAAVHVIAGPGAQVPDWQLSPTVQPLPSLHVAPFGAFVGAGHWPVAGSQVPATLHVGAVHVIGVPAVQLPA
jgi:hypothetical protein